MTTETQVHIARFNVADPVHGEVACIELAPRHDTTLPICLFLYGGGGTCESLLALEPLLAGAPSVTQSSLHLVLGIFINDLTKRATLNGLQELPSAAKGTRLG